MKLDVEALHCRLDGQFSLGYLEYAPEVTSTNDCAMRAAHAGAAGGALFCTDFQTAGRGRRGAAWTAPAESSVLCSLLLRPAVALRPHELAIITGVGAARGLNALGIPAAIKWPNDLMVADRKVGGILVETVGDAVVIGIGVNCQVPETAFPPELRARAGSLDALGYAPPREDVLVALVEGFSEALGRVVAGGIVKVLIDWNKLNWLRRHKVRVSGPLGVVEGDGLFLEGHKLVFHVFKDHGVVPMPLSSTVEPR